MNPYIKRITQRHDWSRKALCLFVGTLMLPAALSANEDYAALDERLSKLEKQLSTVLGELESVKSERDQLRQTLAQTQGEQATLAATQEAMLEEMHTISQQSSGGGSSLPKGLKIGAYGEQHFNFTQGRTANGSSDQSDIHRFVAFLGYDFNDWISFTSETELEHAFVGGGGGDVILEQFYFDMNFTEAVNLRLGRALHPAGIVNRYHEPTAFYGVERPTFSSRILPSTWSIDGVGLWGNLTDWLAYEAYLHAGLNGSGFTPSAGIRNGRMKERPGLNDPGFSSRVDIQPLIALGKEDAPHWRVGLSYSMVGTANANQGLDIGQPQGDVQIFAADSDLTLGRFDFRGEVALLDNSAARAINTSRLAAGNTTGVADEIFGWYLESGYHFLPNSWKKGRFSDSDAVAFVRYGEANTQESVPLFAPDRNDNVTETTVGVSLYPTHNFVLKANYIFVDPEAGTAPDRMDFGFGYDF